MKIGFGAPVAGAWATPGYLTSFSEQAEELGYASLWTFQRLLVPEGSGMEPVYHSVLDPLVALGYVAARTTRIRLGVAIVNLPFVSPTYLAKQAATVDVLSSGRLDLGLGIGWMPEEFTATGATMPRHGAPGHGTSGAARRGLDPLEPRRPDQDRRGGRRDPRGRRRSGTGSGRGADHLPGRDARGRGGQGPGR